MNFEPLEVGLVDRFFFGTGLLNRFRFRTGLLEPAPFLNRFIELVPFLKRFIGTGFIFEPVYSNRFLFRKPV